MRTILAVLSLLLPVQLFAQANKIAGEIAEHTLGPVAKEAAERAAKELVENAAIATGKQVTESTRIQLARAIGQHGEAVVSLARRVPEATEALAIHAPQLLPLAERLGDNILRIEARAPGFAEMAAKKYGEADLPHLLKLSEPEMKGVLSLSTHTTEPRAAKLLLEGTEKGGMSFLEKVSGSQILATGLSVAAITAVISVTNKIPPGPAVLQESFGFLKTLFLPIALVVAALLAIRGGLSIWRKHKRSR